MAVIDKFLAFLWRVAAGNCDGSRAVVNVSIVFSSVFLFAVTVFAYFGVWPWAQSEWRAWKQERRETTAAIIELQRNAGISGALYGERDKDLADAKTQLLDHERRLSRIEGRIR